MLSNLHRCSGNRHEKAWDLDVRPGFLYIGRLSVHRNTSHRFRRRTVRPSEVAGGRYMSWKRRLGAGVLLAGLGIGWRVARAEDPAPPKTDAPATPANPAEPPKKKEPFFGD